MNETTTTTTCEFFALCDNDATHIYHHPILDEVPACERCLDRVGIDPAKLQRA